MFVQKIHRAIDALTDLLKEFEEAEGPPDEPEVVLTRSRRNRRSEKNNVMQLAATNGAPRVPESWKAKSGRNGKTKGVRAWIYKTMGGYEPMSRAELSDLCLAQGVRGTGKRSGGFNSSNLCSLVNTLIKSGQLYEKRGKLYVGKEG